MAKKQKGGKTQIGLRIPDRVMVFLEREQETRPAETTLTEVVTEMLEIAMDIQKGLGEGEWGQVLARGITHSPRLRTGEVLVQMLMEGQACLQREGRKK